MTITITIDVHPDNGPERRQLDDAMEALGFIRQPHQHIALRQDTIDALESTVAAEMLNPIKVPDEPITQAEAEAIVQTAKVRERGKPSPGHARRTKAEIAEDDAAIAAEQAGTTTAEVAGISTGEDRVDPDNPDDASVSEQDAADEAAETAATKQANGGKLTLDDVRKGLGEYVKLYGMAAAQEDGPKLIQKVLGDNTKLKVSDLPDDQAVLAKAVAGTKELCEKNPFKRAKVA
jgi:hypothetical protein